jgi:hypothetical protein
VAVPGERPPWGDGGARGVRAERNARALPRPASREAHVTLAPWRSLSGHVLRADGHPARRATVSLGDGIFHVGPEARCAGPGVSWTRRGGSGCASPRAGTDVSAHSRSEGRVRADAPRGREEIPDDLEIRLGTAQKGTPTERTPRRDPRVTATRACGGCLRGGRDRRSVRGARSQNDDAEGRARRGSRAWDRRLVSILGCATFTTRITGVGVGADERVVSCRAAR